MILHLYKIVFKTLIVFYFLFFHAILTHCLAYKKSLQELTISNPMLLSSLCLTIWYLRYNIYLHIHWLQKQYASLNFNYYIPCLHNQYLHNYFDNQEYVSRVSIMFMLILVASHINIFIIQYSSVFRANDQYNVNVPIIHVKEKQWYSTTVFSIFFNSLTSLICLIGLACFI